MKLSGLTNQELEQLKLDLLTEQERRETVRVEQDFITQRTQKLVEIAGQVGELLFEDMPPGGHLPGQVVSYAKKRWRNVSGLVTELAPGKKLDVWEELTPEEENPAE